MNILYFRTNYGSNTILLCAIISSRYLYQYSDCIVSYFVFSGLTTNLIDLRSVIKNGSSFSLVGPNSDV